MDITKKVADFIVNTSYEKIPNEGINNAKLAVLDCLGVTLAGSTNEASRIVGGLIKEYMSHPIATVIGQGFRTSIPDAAFVNGIAAHVLDYDDGASLSVPLHPSAPVLPAVISLGEAGKKSGKKIVEAYIVGYEIETRLAEAVTVGHYENGWHTTGTLGSLGATSAACKILNLSLEETRTALGIATSMVGGLRENFGTMTKPLHAGNAAKNGVLAAMLAKRGFTASLNILDGKFGFFKLYGTNDVRIKNECIENLGNPFRIISPGLSVKPYPSCRGTHSSIDAMINLVKENSISPEEVETIECRISPLSDGILVYSNPQTGNEGKFSLEFCTAVAFLEKKVNWDHFTDEKVKDPNIRKIMKKIKRYRFSEGEMSHHLSSITKIILKNGSIYSRTVNQPKGSPNNPVSKEDSIEKFMECTKGNLHEKKIGLLLDMIGDLENLRDISELTKLLI